MNSQVKQILKLNKKFYQFVAKDFSESRQSAWKGWEKAIKVFLSNRDIDKKNIRILDLGCGNGRFVGYISGKASPFSYKGYDTNNDLLLEAGTKYKSKGNNKIKFANKDVVEHLSEIKPKYDLVVCFGITHHIPDKNFRTKWFTKITKLCEKNGVLILSFWEFEKKPGDYLIGWNNKNIARFCHQYSSRELGIIKNIFTKKGFKLLDEYKADNKNTYLVFGNI